MKVLLLGASGFVGSNVLPELLRAGVEVVSLCRNPESHVGRPSVPGLSWISIDEALQRPVSGIDSLLSLAGVGSPSLFEQQPEAMAAAEQGITELISDLAVSHRLNSVQYLSTAGGVYGEGWVGELDGGYGQVLTEESECQPVSVYGKCKLFAEKHLTARLELLSPDTTLSIIRATNIYGLRYQKAGQQGLINALLDQCYQGTPVTLYGDGLVYRDYLFASDLAAAHLACLARPASGIFNIGAGYSHSILQVIAAVEFATGSCLKRLQAPERIFDVRYSAVSIDKARALFGWSPLVDLGEGISKIISFYRSNLKLPC
jgi:UDP-glucose 4-epimerase